MRGHHGLRRRERIEQTPTSGPDLAPRGHAPFLQYHFHLEGAAGITWWSFYLPLYRRPMPAAKVIDFLDVDIE
jgi:hypothetical protein